MHKIFYFLPIGYFVKTRLNTKQAILFHGYAEFLLGILLLIYSGIPFINAVTNFFFAYLAFISVYEIGYIFNDFVSIKYEKDPRKRLGRYEPDNMMIFYWILIRITCFLLVSYYFNMLSTVGWWLFYFLLALVFALHNILNKKDHKIFTFFSLALFRFYAPLFIFIPSVFFILSIPAIIMHYVFFRTLTYMDSKGILNIPNRNSLSFKTSFYLLLLPVSVIISYLSDSWLIIYINLYFLIFWYLLQIMNIKGIINVKDIKTS